MVDPINSGHTNAKVQKAVTKFNENPNNHISNQDGQTLSQIKKPGGIDAFFKKMFPAASDTQIKQMVDNWQKCIGDQISRDQRFHEEQEDERKSEEGENS